MYAFAAGLPVLIIALFGNKIQEMHPDVVSISDFTGKRFGPIFRTIVGGMPGPEHRLQVAGGPQCLQALHRQSP